MAQYSDNARTLAIMLQSAPGVSNVSYPGLTREGGWGGLVYFELEGGPDAVVEFCDGLERGSIATSFGHRNTLVMPIGAIPEEITGKPTNGWVRVAVGLTSGFEPELLDIRRQLRAMS